MGFFDVLGLVCSMNERIVHHIDGLILVDRHIALLQT